MLPFISPPSSRSLSFQIKSSHFPPSASSTLRIQKRWRVTPPSYEYATSEGRGGSPGEKPCEEIQPGPPETGSRRLRPPSARVFRGQDAIARPGAWEVQLAPEEEPVDLVLAWEMWHLSSPSEPIWTLARRATAGRINRLPTAGPYVPALCGANEERAGAPGAALARDEVCPLPLRDFLHTLSATRDGQIPPGIPPADVEECWGR